MRRLKKFTWEQRRSYMGYVFILPLILGVITVFIPNIVQTIQFSLNDLRMTGTGYDLTFKGLQYYRDALMDDPKFTRLLLSCLRTLAVNVPVVLIFSLFISTLLNQQFRGRLLARIIFFVPVILSTGVIATMDGSAANMIANSAIDTGAGGAGADFLQFTNLLTSLEFGDFLVDIVVGAVSGIYTIVKSSGMQIFIFLAGLQEISPSLYEAASVEGCSKWELFWKITFPMISPQIAVCAVYTFAEASSGDHELFTYINDLAFSQNQYALATAMSVLYLLCLCIIIAVVFWALSRLLRNQGR